MKERIIVSGITMALSLACYYYARVNGKDAVPWTMIGGFAGAMLGETLVNFLKKDNDDNDQKPQGGIS